MLIKFVRLKNLLIDIYFIYLIYFMYLTHTFTRVHARARERVYVCMYQLI